jgi:holliday junction DNA helicase RuvA
MIAFVRGRLVEAHPPVAVVDTQGVGYEILIPMSSYERLPSPGADVTLLTHLVVREDAHTLYGFITAEERELFRALVQHVSGVGPKMALNLLSGLSVAALGAAVAAGDIKTLASISGVGRKTAERIVVELKDKLRTPKHLQVAKGAEPQGPRSIVDDAAAALMALGFKPADAAETARAVSALLGPDSTLEELVRACLKKG